MDLDPSVVWDFAGTLVGTLHERPRQLPATVSRVDHDGTVWLSMPGADGLVPASTTADVSADDAVTVEWWGNAYHVTGNGTSPSIGTRAARALRRATAAAAKVAGEAKCIADAVGQHFWADDNGVHVSNEDGNATGERNILMNSLGILLRQGSAWLASFSDSAVSFFDGLGNEAENIVARFGRDGAQIGYADTAHAEIDSRSLQFVARYAGVGPFFRTADETDANGFVQLVNGFTGDGTTTDFSLDPAPTMLPPEQYVTTVTVNGTSVGFTLASTWDGFIYVKLAQAPASGSSVVVTYWCDKTVAPTLSFGQNIPNVVRGIGSVALGNYTSAEQSNSVAIGNSAHSYAKGAVVIGEAIYARGENQTVLGKNNANDPDHALEVGNGVVGARSNALAVGWDGTVTHYGDVPWTNLPLTSSVVAFSNGQVPMYRKWGPVVTLCGAVKMTSAQSADFVVQIGQLPEGCRPKRTLNVLCQGSNREVWLLDINESGVVRASRYRKGDTLVAVTTSTWFPFTATFLVA
jgi:hypothetical protein